MVGVVKFTVAVILLPLIYAATQGYTDEMARSKSLAEFFWRGVFAYTFWHLFVFTFARLFDFIQKIFSELFRFSAVVQSVVPNSIPFGPTMLLILYYLCSHIFRFKGGEPVVFFLAGFSLAVHVILMAAQLYEEDQTVVKSHYFFSLGLFYLANLMLVSMLLDLNFESFSFIRFWQQSADLTLHHYKYILHKFIL